MSKTKTKTVRFVMVEKRSKKEQRALNAAQRGSWGICNPVSRTIPSGKTYDRNKAKAELRSCL